MSASSDHERGFSFDYDPGELRGGRGCVADLGDALDRRGLDSALIVTGSNVGANPDVMDPVVDGLGGRLAGVFDETKPAKSLGTGLAVARQVGEGIDVIVAVGSRSSLDVAKTASALGSHAAAERALESGTVAVADDGDSTPVVAVPTTLAGADLSVIAGVGLTLDTDDAPAGGVPTGSVRDRRLMPTTLFYDPALFETTPRSVLCASAMNGFDKAVECLYAPDATPVTDGTATRALSLMQSEFRTLSDDEMDEERLCEAVTGVLLAQYGISTPETYRASIIHAFGHGLSHDHDVHQGIAHAVLAPHVLRYVFDRVDGRRGLLAAGLGVDRADATPEEVADAVVESVEGVRDDLRLPARLSTVDVLSRDHLPSVAAVVRDDALMRAVPRGVDPSESEILDVLQSAW